MLQYSYLSLIFTYNQYYQNYQLIIMNTIIQPVYFINNDSTLYFQENNLNTIPNNTIKKNTMQNMQKDKNQSPVKNQVSKFAQAQLYFSKLSYRKKQIQADGSHTYLKFRLFDSNQVFQEYGLGIYFYLEFIKYMVFLFVICSIIAGIQINYNIQGTGLESYPSSYVLQLLKTSLGNNTDLSVYQIQIQTGCDITYSILILIFIFYWRYKSATVITQNQQDLTLLNPQKYCVSIKGITQYSNTEQIKDFIERQFRCRVYEVNVVYDFKRKFEHYVDYSELNTQLQIEKLNVIRQNQNDYNITQIKKKMEKLSENLLKQNIQPVPLYFIIHFLTISQVSKFVKTLETYYSIDQYSYKIPKLICCACCINQIPQNLLFRDKQQIILLHRKCGRPQDIIWENLDIMRIQKTGRTILGTISILLLLGVASITIAICMIFINSSNDCTTYDNNTTIEQAIADPALDYCFCQSNLVSIFTNIEIGTLCNSFKKKILISEILQIVAALISTITNILLTILINVIVTFMKPKNKSEGYEKKFIYILFATMINSITLPLLINASIFGVRPAFFFKIINISNFLNFQNLVSYGDFTKNWYAYVAPYYINFFLIGIFNPWIGLIQTIILQQFKRYRLKNKQNEIIQKIMNEGLASFEFDLPVASASLMLYIIFALIYSSSIPILLPILSIILYSHYICSKYIIINYSRQISINQDINAFIIKLLPFVLLVHIGFGIWTYTCDDIFPFTLFEGMMLQYTTFGNSLDRIFYINYFTVAFIILIGGILIDTTLINFLTWFSNCCCGSDVQVQSSHVSEQGFDKRLERTNILGSYNIQKNAKYKDTIGLMKKLYKSSRKENVQITEYNLGNNTMQTIDF